MSDLLPGYHPSTYLSLVTFHLGTAIFLSIGSALTAGGPLSLLLGFSIWSTVAWAVNEGQAEMVCEVPIESSFVRFAGRYVDDAVGVAVGA